MTKNKPRAAEPGARQRRQLAKLTAEVNRWWSAVPDHARLRYYGMDAIAAAVGRPRTYLGTPLRAMGWLRVQVRVQGNATVVWVPPGYPSPLRARGRPRKHREAQSPRCEGAAP